MALRFGDPHSAVSAIRSFILQCENMHFKFYFNFLQSQGRSVVLSDIAALRDERRRATSGVGWRREKCVEERQAGEHDKEDAEEARATK